MHVVYCNSAHRASGRRTLSYSYDVATHATQASPTSATPYVLIHNLCSSIIESESRIDAVAIGFWGHAPCQPLSTWKHEPHDKGSHVGQRQETLSSQEGSTYGRNNLLRSGNQCLARRCACEVERAVDRCNSLEGLDGCLKLYNNKQMDESENIVDERTRKLTALAHPRIVSMRSSNTKIFDSLSSQPSSLKRCKMSMKPNTKDWYEICEFPRMLMVRALHS
jgi:hypothetical protein